MVMIPVTCPSCGAKYRLDDAKLGGTRAKVKCPKCQVSFEVGPTEPVAATVPFPSETEATTPAPTARERPRKDATARAQRIRSDQDVGGETITTSGLSAAGGFELPSDKKYSIAVLDGKASGEIFAITKTRTTLGRAGTDIVLDDPECSRQHAVLEILGARATITDHDSTNGTFVDGKRVDKADLENQSEFRIGDHVLMLIITERE